MNIVHKTLEQVHLVMGFPGLPHAAPERYALFLLNDVIGGSMSSRLFQEVRERQGLVYSIHSGAQAFADTGLLYVYAATDAAELLQGAEVDPQGAARRSRRHGVTAEELRAGQGSPQGQPDALAGVDVAAA